MASCSFNYIGQICPRLMRLPNWYCILFLTLALSWHVVGCRPVLSDALFGGVDKTYGFHNDLSSVHTSRVFVCVCCVAACVALRALHSRSNRRRHFVLSLPRNGNLRAVIFPFCQHSSSSGWYLQGDARYFSRHWFPFTTRMIRNLLSQAGKTTSPSLV